MNILSIASVLPIPNYIKENDVIFKYYDHYCQKTSDNIFFIRPIIYSNNLFAILSNKWSNYNKVNKLKKYEYNNFRVELLPYITKRTSNNIHAVMSNSLYSLNKSKLNKIVKKNNIDLTHAQYLFPDGLLALRLKQKNKINYVLTLRSETKYFDNFFSNYYSKKILEEALYITTLNYKTYLHLKKLGFSNVELIPHGVDTSFFRKIKQQSKEKVRILSIGNLIKLKNIDKVLCALAEPINNCIKYTIIGQGPEYKNLCQIVKEKKMENIVEFIPHIPNEKIVDEIVKHDIFVLPSFPETFGRVYFEAIAAGLPVICAKDSGVYGYFEDKKEILYVDPNNIEELKDSLNLLIKNFDIRKEMAKKAQKKVCNFTWSDIVKKFQQIYLKNIVVHKKLHDKKAEYNSIYN